MDSGAGSSHAWLTLAYMVFTAHVVKVLIASPGDTADERNAVDGAIGDWNASRAEQARAILLPWRWERHAIPRLGSTAQGVINEQAVDSSRRGNCTLRCSPGNGDIRAVSGTAEEILRANAAGKFVHVYFSSEDLPRDVEIQQLAALRAFKQRLEAEGLLGSYASPGDLAYRSGPPWKMT